MTLRPGTAHEVSAAGPPHWREVSAALASAFYDDPVWSWLLPDDATRISSLRRFFGIEARHIVLQHGRSLAGKDGDEILGAALVLPPGRWRTPLRVQALHAPGYARVFGRRLPRALGVLAQMERRHPSRPHSYLAYVGVAASAQERGLGTALLTPMLDRCDRERLPAYLEASSPASARLYARLGFTTIEEIRPLGAPPIQLMSREPAA
jgi:RimJ/RimL family protein N-acetyltransferase